MAFRVIWTQTASSDLQALVRYISSDNSHAARRIAERILDQIDSAAAFPLTGRLVPEKQDASMRERILKPYRIVYTVNETHRVIHVVRIWHASRGEPEID
jgi:toxin ParE1/3/4